MFFGKEALDQGQNSIGMGGCECSGSYRNEEDRLRTFQNWPDKQVDPVNLAKLGFFYTQCGDEIQCAFCGLQISNWCPDCDPNFHHRLNSRQCDFLQKRECGNVPTWSQKKCLKTFKNKSY